jgi:hypothetical protein
MPGPIGCWLLIIGQSLRIRADSGDKSLTWVPEMFSIRNLESEVRADMSRTGVPARLSLSKEKSDLSGLISLTFVPPR